MHAVTSATDAGSLDRNRSVRRTDPTSSDTDHSMSSPVPTTSSVEPPPMSTTSVRACSRSRVAPRNEARASSSPASTTGRTPRMPSIASSNSAALSASRTADVAQNRTWSAPNIAISSAYSRVA